MNTHPPALDEQAAGDLARQFNQAFTSATHYGPRHPTTMKALEAFTLALGEHLASRDRITLLRDNEALFLEAFDVGSRLNARRIVDLCRRRDLHSVSFEKGVAADDVGLFIEMFADPGRYGTTETLQRQFAQQRRTGVRLNYITWARVSADQKIISSSAPAAAAADAQQQEQLQTINALGGVISLKALLENPRLLASDILRGAATDAGVRQTLVIDYLRRLNASVQEQTVSRRTISPTELVESVYKLKVALRDGLSLQQEMGRLLQGNEPVLDEVNELTWNTIVGLVRSEYRAGGVSIKRLAHIIARLVPESANLKRLIPRLREGLEAEGMRLPDFLQLVKELNRELCNEGLADVLEKGADALGFKAHDVIEAARSNPDEAAALLILASEIRQARGGEDSGLADLLAEHVEAICSRQVLGETGSQGAGLRTVLVQLQKRLLEKLGRQGLDAGVLAQVEQQLAGRFQQTLAQLKNDWIGAMLEKGGEVAPQMLVQMLDAVVDREFDKTAFDAALRRSLARQGLSGERIDALCRRLADNGSSAASDTPQQPGVLNARNTLFFLQRLVKENHRYGNPFSVVQVSVTCSSPAREPPPPNVLEQVTRLCRTALRDLDIVGSLGRIANQGVFIILPMTPQEGAAIAARRLQQGLNAVLAPGGTHQVVVSLTFFDRALHTDARGLVDQARAQHQRRCAPPHR